MEAAPIILTLKLDAGSFARLDGLRRRWFPPKANHIPAHLTLFHKLPGEDVGEVVRRVGAGAPATLALRATGLRRLGRGVAVEIGGDALLRYRAELAAIWRDQLTAQDRQPFHPHVTIQNKVEPSEAAALHDQLQSGFEPFDLVGEGVLVWRYLGGPWDLAAEVPFRPAG